MRTVRVGNASAVATAEHSPGPPRPKCLWPVQPAVQGAHRAIAVCSGASMTNLQCVPGRRVAFQLPLGLPSQACGEGSERANRLGQASTRRSV